MNGDFEIWRDKARDYLRRGVTPEDAVWDEQSDSQPDLFASPVLPGAAGKDFLIPKDFIALARRVSCHSDPARWRLLYLALWRIVQGEKHLLQMATDDLTHRLLMADKAVGRDAHKTKAFVRFKLIPDEGGERYIAWHRPDHSILPLVAPFFQRRFSVMRWAIMTPQECVSWDGEDLLYGKGVPTWNAPGEDRMEDLWRVFYRAIFNPARIKLAMMRREMPVRHWATLPETSIIPSMLAEAPDRVAAMIAHQEGHKTSAADFVPAQRDIPSLMAAAKKCEGCPLHCHATQTVFGTGPAPARIMLIGEQPGDKEDVAGQPFVGPAGQVLDQAMAAAGVERSKVYMTNAVKHFKFIKHDRERYHRSPNASEINACRPWLLAEIAAVKPEAVVCLGVSAARSLLGPGFTLKNNRGQWLESQYHPKILTTYHPSAFLRMPDEDKKAELYAHLVDDLRMAMGAVNG